MKLDMGAAWNSAVAMLAANRDVVAIVAGVFFFLPYLALILLLPAAVEPRVDGNPEDFEAIRKAIGAMYADNWWALLLLSILQGIGALALLALLTDRARPTVGEALQRGAVGFAPYLVSQITAALGIGLVLGIPIAGAIAAGSPALIFVVGSLAVVALIYAIIKFSLIAQVIAIDGILNPVHVLKRSWKLTKGNSLRLLGFYFLLAIAVGIVMLVVSLAFGALFAALGGQAELIGNGVVTSSLNAVFAVIGLAVLAAVHRQLAGPSTEAVSETFE